MNSRDRSLGMDSPISRRDFLGGSAIAIGAAIIPGCSRADDPLAERISSHYPPAETGMRGAHSGSFEVAHGLVQGESWAAKPTGEHYDLVVVGAGISGLSAAYIYRRDVDPDARILILDNHDDFGGHAKRNEFGVNGRTIIGFGGTMLIEAPRAYPEIPKRVFRELGIETHDHEKYQNNDLYVSRGMAGTSFLDKETFGADFMLTGPLADRESWNDAPLSDQAKDDLARLFADKIDYLEGMSPVERKRVLDPLSWSDYLETHAGMGQEALSFLQKRPESVWSIGADAFPAWMACFEGYPGFAGMDIGLWGPEEEEADTSRFHFPDGNATVARLLVRYLIPEVAEGQGMEDVVSARFDYSVLDRPENAVSIRLDSTVIGLRHKSGGLTGPVEVTYVREGEGFSVGAERIVWSGYHAMLPHVCPDIPEEQRDAMRSSVRSPLVYTNVLIRNWNSLVEVGMRRAYCPGSFFQSVMADFPVSIGDYAFPQSPDEPLVLHLQHIPLEPGLSAPEQFRQGRRRLLETPFEVFERNIRDQLGRMLGPGGFDPAQDILGITVNRWPHGYAYSIDEDTQDVAWWPEFWPHESKPWEVARQRIGNIAIAGTDAASDAMTEAAIEQAHRAVHSFSV